MLPSFPFVDQVLRQRHRRHAPVVVPDDVRHFAAFHRRHISSPSAAFIASGFSHRIIFPAFAAASAISLCVLFGVQMSIASMSLRSISFRQSVSTDSYPHLLANALDLLLVPRARRLQHRPVSQVEEILTFRYALECARPMKP
jgi:hypothetical protein